MKAIFYLISFVLKNATGLLPAFAALVVGNIIANADSPVVITNIFPTLTIREEECRNVKVTKVTDAEVTLKYDGGGGRVSRCELPPELAKFYPCNSAASQTVDSQRNQAMPLIKRSHLCSPKGSQPFA